MILLQAAERDGTAARIVAAALRRSFTARQIGILDPRELPPRTDNLCAVLVEPAGLGTAWLADALGRGAKLLLLGRLSAAQAELLGVALDGSMPPPDLAACEPAPPHGAAESGGHILYAHSGLAAAVPLRRRPLQRFDFAAEWNNLGYGRIGLDSDTWSIATAARAADAIAVLAGGEGSWAYAVLRDLPRGSLLWFNRAVGPVDGPDWRLVEAFFSDHRPASLPCRPHLREVPAGYAAALTMRVDCDEAIASAGPLFSLYRGRGLPFSAAVATGLPAGPADDALLRAILDAGGSVLSHSVSHGARWGGSAAAALGEAAASKAALEARLPGLSVRHAVSPFHQTPAYAIEALFRAGYGAVVGGLISAEPEHVLGRAGQVPCVDNPFVMHSQQCMLHGDCVADAGDGLAIYREAFRLARGAHAIFGYLDHPFSDRYAYGWPSEPARLAAHEALLDHALCDRGEGPVLFMSESECLDFLAARNGSSLACGRDGSVAVELAGGSALRPAIGYRGRWWRADDPRLSEPLW